MRERENLIIAEDAFRAGGCVTKMQKMRDEDEFRAGGCVTKMNFGLEDA